MFYIVDCRDDSLLTHLGVNLHQHFRVLPATNDRYHLRLYSRIQQHCGACVPGPVGRKMLAQSCRLCYFLQELIILRVTNDLSTGYVLSGK